MQKARTQKQKKAKAQEMVTMAAYARSRGLAPSTITRQVASGAIPLHDGRVNPGEADAARAANIRQRTSAAETVSVAGKGRKAISFTEARRRRELAMARQAELRLRERQGAVVEIDRVGRWITGMIARAASVLDAIPEELGDRLAHESDPQRVTAILREKIDKARNELADYREAKKGTTT